ncbi:hypothetical protein C5B86_04765 [Haloferax sp. Atlit-19N]|uniref:hypothetical protein n=1 Tax=Haloferax sp. Atlit-19N TaxID=2077201 RepID=UPI000E24CF1B|nr:hypothetical protein [Haloferax sp. Atlit-19N]RDZ48361.1 hypothetical protein C5B86_04765 [Haloferax sp. Atlit-19N]
MTNLTDAIQPYLSSNESIRAARANDSSAVVVTDRRVMEVKRGSDSRGRDLKLAKSTLITGPNILGVKIVEEGSERVDLQGLAAGLVALVLGLGIFFITERVSGELAGLAELVGLASAFIGGIIGVVYIWNAVQTKQGAVTVKVIGDDGDVIETISLAEEEADVAAEISSVIGA